MILDNKRLVDGLSWTLFIKMRNSEFPRLSILPRRSSSQTRAKMLFCLLDSFLWCSLPTVIRGRRHKFSISLVIFVYMLALDLSVIRENTEKI